MLWEPLAWQAWKQKLEVVVTADRVLFQGSSFSLWSAFRHGGFSFKFPAN
jgi:hypothetical protein